MIELDTFGTLVSATLVLLLGRKCVQTVPLLNRYTIPEPVAGGLLVALGLLAAKHFFGWELMFDNAMKEPLMLAFFATIGLNADISSLRTGGKALCSFVGVVVGLLLVQNILGIGLATLMGLNPLTGLLSGSITLSGGHGTGAAWGKVFTERYGFSSATELAMACATFGLVLGGLIGGPVARYLVKHSATPEGCPEDLATPSAFEKPLTGRLITPLVLIETIAMIAICLSAGSYLARLLHGTPCELPTFVCVLFIGVVLSNMLSVTGMYRVFDRAVSVVGNVSLSLFLAMALMSLKLWELSALAVPMLVILTVQTLAMALYAVFVTYRVMGRNYDAAVLAAGHCGFGLGATPTAIANMQAITGRFGPSHLAFLIVPMVGAFFIDIANALVIKLFLMLPGIEFPAQAWKWPLGQALV
ncbi:sodium/glutamate symporter [Chimaeribacter arupi]|uniref:Sodium/glutamate symporter n=1 Tax=Chimaeribacter arupi TaxID=2060066 RepID=A0A2N5EL94_9GAMM|nr:sodium/glutamate symporter [Chimaeribacter arupi]PLR42851.1 sodium/glutamate symporter [Chimaeribacter arupi]PLR44300.1 sodium/glutamate symporter [Chimaeribacter arupi]PLR47728.1 sodium/glutamate symporter [Chimaeribacter arupi]